MEQFRPLPKELAAFYDGPIEEAPDFYLEQMVIKNHQVLMMERAPGKYDSLIQNIDRVSNFNPLSHVFPRSIPPAGAGLYPDAEVPYYFGRITDDIVDIDIPLPSGYVSIPHWINVMEHHIYDNCAHVRKAPTVEFLLKRTIERMEKYPNIDIRSELLRFFNSMHTEYNRREQKTSLPRRELWNMYQEGFGSPYSIMLAAFRSKNRENDIIEIPQIQGRLYAISGMADDLNKGIIGIPKEELEAAGISDAQAIQLNTDILSVPAIAKWKEQEIAQCEKLTQTLLDRKLDLSARIYLKALL